MKITLAFLFLLGMLVGQVHGQSAPAMRWERRFGDRSKVGEYSSQIVRLSADRILVLGTTYTIPPGGRQSDASTLWIFNQRGDSIRTIFPTTGVPNEQIGVSGVAVLPDGDWLMVGGGGDPTQTTYAAQVASSFMFIARTDSLGNYRWFRRYNQGLATAPIASPVLLPDGGAVLLLSRDVGTTVFNSAQYSYVARIDAAGTLLWQRGYGNSYAGLSDIVACPDGSYALGGYQMRRDASQRLVPNGWLLRLTADGDSVRSRYWGNTVDGQGFYDLKVTSDGGLLLAGARYPGYYQQPYTPGVGWLQKLDSLDRPQWSYDILAAQPQLTRGAAVYWLELLQGDKFVVRGSRYQTGGGPGSANSYLGGWQLPAPGNTTPTPLWDMQFSTSFENDESQQAMGADGSITVGGFWDLPLPGGYSRHIRLTHYEPVGVPYQPNLCQIPPVANATYVQPVAYPDSLNLFDLSTAGPAYGQLVRWRWELGDGTVVERTQAGWVRHRYTVLPAAGTPVRLTITNNLGCTSTQLLYPFGLPSATQASRQLAASLSLYPNPATHTVTLHLGGLRAQPVVPGQLLNALGQVVQTLPLPVRGGELSQVLDLTGLAAGVYALRLPLAEGVVTKRLVKQ
jgi:hypothetical protein